MGAVMVLASIAIAGPAGSSPIEVEEFGVEEFTSYAASSDLSEGHADVFRLYWAFFDREPDVTGARYWAEEYTECATLLDITWSFSQSVEFEGRYSDITDSEYIWLVYRNVLGREPDPFGEAYWLELLNDGELIRSEIMLYFSLSTEFKRRHPLPSDGRPFSGSGCTDSRGHSAAPTSMP
jgi:hypothetical protein